MGPRSARTASRRMCSIFRSTTVKPCACGCGILVGKPSITQSKAAVCQCHHHPRNAQLDGSAPGLAPCLTARSQAHRRLAEPRQVLGRRGNRLESGRRKTGSERPARIARKLSESSARPAEMVHRMRHAGGGRCGGRFLGPQREWRDAQRSLRQLLSPRLTHRFAVQVVDVEFAAN